MTNRLCRVCPALPLAMCLAAGSPATAQSNAAAASSTPPAAASTAETEPNITPDTESPWRIGVATWVWVLGLEGDVGVRGRSAQIDASFVDIVDASDSILAFSGRVEVAYKRFGMYADGFYADLGVEEATGPRGVGNVEIEYQQTIIDFGAMYRILDREPAGRAVNNHHTFTIDLYAGGRYSSVELSLDPRNLSERSHKENWIDPIFGAKLLLPITESWHIAFTGDVGGFGVASDLTWGATAVVGYDFKLFDFPASAMLGYRAIGWDYTSDDSSSFDLEVIEHGIILGFAMRF